MNKTPNTFITFFKYNVVAIIATAVDFVVLVSLTEVLHFWYLFSAFLGAFTGGITGFILERNWTFMKRDGKLSIQAIKYLLVWAISIFLNVTGIFLFVEYMGCQYIISKIIVAIIIGIGFNFLTHKYFVYK